MASNAQPVWAGEEFRLDPTRLPQKMSYASPQNGDALDITVGIRGTVVKHVDGLSFNIALPNNAFRGIAARANVGDEENDALVTLELLHDDENLCVPLRVGNDLAAIAKDWQLWSELLKLPMMIIDSDGVARSLEESAAHAVMNKSDKNHTSSMFADERPRFLARQRLGNLGVRVMVKGQEIIARN